MEQLIQESWAQKLLSFTHVIPLLDLVSHAPEQVVLFKISYVHKLIRLSSQRIHFLLSIFTVSDLVFYYLPQGVHACRALVSHVHHTDPSL